MTKTKTKTETKTKTDTKTKTKTKTETETETETEAETETETETESVWLTVQWGYVCTYHDVREFAHVLRLLCDPPQLEFFKLDRVTLIFVNGSNSRSYRRLIHRLPL